MNLNGRIDRLLAEAKNWSNFDAFEIAGREVVESTRLAARKLRKILPSDLYDRTGELFAANAYRVLKSVIGMPVTGFVHWPEAVADLLAVTPADLCGRVIDALAPGERERSPLDDWTFDVAIGRSRFPDGLTVETVRRLLTILFDRADEIGNYWATCSGCGLQRPTAKLPPISEWKLLPGKSPDSPPPRYDLPEFFRVCPHCGCDKWNWAHLQTPYAYEPHSPNNRKEKSDDDD